ncbi:MAG: hypothetical protein GY847_05435 [Proteobacteria bacterium]|nr:hypothetical protein [Pseudomonadota bacterium]
MRTFITTLSVLLLATQACEPTDVTMSLMAYDKKTDSYLFKDVEVKTLTDIDRLEGDSTTIYGGATVVLNYEEDYLKWKDGGHSVAFEAVEKNGVLVPEDYDSLAMASIYYNIELSRTFFIEELGLPEDALGELPTYYWLDFEIVEQDGEKSTMLDNAFYMYMGEKSQAFFVVPFDRFQWIPMPLNSGIITHEYTHAVFDTIVLGMSDHLEMNDSGTNFLNGINEGCADFMAVARTGDPDFIAHSIPSNLFFSECNWPGRVRDLARDASDTGNWNYAVSIDQPARNLSTYDFCPYDVGSFWTVLMYEIAGTINLEKTAKPSDKSLKKVARWLMEALQNLGDQLEQDFEIWDLLSLFVMRINSQADREAACDVIEQRYQYNSYYTQVSGC